MEMNGSSKKAAKSLSLRIKLISLSVGITFLVGLASLGVLRYVLETQESAQLNNFEAYAENLSDALGAQFFERYGDVQAFAINPTLQSLDRQSIINALNVYSAAYGIYDLILVVDTKGSLVAVNNKNPEGEEIQVQSLYQKNYSETPWFKSVMSGNLTNDKEKGLSGTFFEDVQIDPWTTQVFQTNRIGNSFSAPIKDLNGKVVGVISNRVGSRWFETAFHDLYEILRKNGYVHSELTLLGKDGLIYFEYKNNKKPNKINDKSSRKSNVQEYDWNRVLKINLSNTNSIAAKNLLGRKTGSIVESLSGDRINQIVGYTPVTSEKFIDKIGWSILVADDQSEVMTSLRHAQNIFYFIFALIVAIASTISYFFSVSLSKAISDLATRLSDGSNEVFSAATKISQSSTELSDAATEQASAIQETAASIDEVSSMVKKSADNATQSQKVSQSSRTAAEQGQQAVQEMIQSINDISQSNNTIMDQVVDGNRKISEIVQVISEIGNKTKVINDIVFQTKLLSFNASVEAARAGEHGKGFAVVAEEVGNLAQMSGNAAKEITSMLDASIQKVEGIVTETKTKVERLVVESKTKVEAGTLVANRCGEALNNILASVQEVDGMVGEISSASQEQAQGVSEINRAINQLDQVTHQNTGIARGAASAAEELSSQSNQLRVLVQDLFRVVNGTTQVILNGNENKRAQPKTHGNQIQKNELTGKDEAVSKVVHMKESRQNQNKSQQLSKPQKKKLAQTTIKLAAGAESGGASHLLPSKDDPRFEDI